MGPTTCFDDFEVKFKDTFRTIFGGDGTGQYGLISPVSIFNETYRIYFNFEVGLLQRYSLELISGIAKKQINDYPEYWELQKEIQYLFTIYKLEFKGDFLDEFEWRKLWKYNWGRIALTQIAHSYRVVTDILWE
ncbi:MAG: hypothetical protein M3Y65_16145 [Pseudomonadota bacterium]|nr:hypothetical protein [Pseudomonadota bacterium]